MAAIPQDRAAKAARRNWLKQVVADGGRVRQSTALLLLDTLAAIGFAGGIAGGVAALAQGQGLLGWALLAALSGVVRGICVLLGTQQGALGARDAKDRLRRRIVAAVLRRAPGAEHSAGALVHAAVDEVEALDGHVARFLPARTAAALAPMLVLVAVALASPVSALILAGTLFPFIFALALAGGAAADESRRQFDALSRLSGLFADRVRALPVVLAFGAAPHEADRLGAAAHDVARRTLRVLRVAFLSSGALEFFSALSVALVAVYCGFNLLGLLPFPVPETLDLASAFFVLALAPEFYAPLRRLAAAYHDKQAAETAADRLSAIEAEAAPRVVAPAVPPLPAISFESVTIHYPGADRPAVSGFSLHIAPGEIVALLGPSGSGKTSLLQLLLGLSPRTAGAIRIGTEVLAPGASIADHAAWLGQSTLLLPASIADNVKLAHPTATKQQISDSCTRAGLHQMLHQRPLGLDSVLDERGSGLSGGERRRIGLARALLKPAPILLLDEPTAHLDAEAAWAMIATLRAACEGRTVLIATHSPELAALANRTVTLERPA